MKCRLGLARSSGTESSRRPPRVVDALVAPLLSVPLQPKWGPGASVERAPCLFRERLISHFDSFPGEPLISSSFASRCTP